MYKLLNIFKRVLIILHVIEAHFGPHKIRNGSATCSYCEPCSTDICKAQSKYIFDRMDFTKNFCDDFYVYTCGKYLQRPEKVLPSTSKLAEQEAATEVTKILEDRPSILSPNFPLLKVLSDALFGCLNGGKKIDDLRAMLDEFGGLPMLHDNWTEKSFHWLNFYTHAYKYGFFANDLFSILVKVDIKNTESRIITIDIPKQYHEYYSMPHDHLCVQSMGPLGNRYIDKIIDAFGGSSSKSQADINDMLELKDQLKKVYKEVPKTLKERYNKRKIEEISSRWDQIPWLNILMKLHKSAAISLQSEVVVICPECLDKLNTLLKNTSARTIQNYVLFGFITENIFLLNDKLRQEISLFTKYTLKGLCHKLMIKWFYPIIDFEYKERHEASMHIKLAESIFENIREQAILFVEEKSLFADAEQKKIASEKLKKLTGRFGWDARVATYENVEKILKKVNFTSPPFYIWDMKRYFFLSHYDDIVEKTKFRDFLKITKPSAHYAVFTNTLNVPGAYIKHLLSAYWPMYINYGRFGRIVAHEITHIFGDQGIEFDQFSNFNDWINNVTLANTLKAERCIIDQLNNTTIPGMNITVNGTASAQECLADNGGIDLAYHSYMAWLATNVEDPLPNLQNYTPIQMFWISGATGVCEKYDYTTADSVHPVHHVRFDLAIKNSKDFMQHFNCQEGTQMNPTHKCHFWEP